MYVCMYVYMYLHLLSHAHTRLNPRISPESMDEVDPNWPVIEDPQNYTYIRPEGDGLMVGLFEGTGAPWQSKEIPDNFSFGEIEPDWERMAPYVEAGECNIYFISKSCVRLLIICRFTAKYVYVCMYEIVTM